MIAMISEFGSMMFWGTFPFILILIIISISACGEELLDFFGGIFGGISNMRDKGRKRRERKRKEKREYKERILRYKIALKKLELLEKGKDISAI